MSMELVLPMSTLGRVLVEQGDHAAAASLMKECITLCRKSGSTWELSRSLVTLGATVWLEGDLMQAIALTQESLMLARELGDKARIDLPCIKQFGTLILIIGSGRFGASQSTCRRRAYAYP